MQASSAPVVRTLPRELVLASAGSGKTFHISSRFIALLAAGARPDEVFASTFTRKAAGEILDRVLIRLAEAAGSDDAARTMAQQAGIQHLAGSATAGFWRDVLADTVRDLHRVSISTLDAFFVRAVRSFSLDLGLPAQWSMADEPARRRIREQALQDVFAAGGPEAVTEILRAMAGGRAVRSVQESILDRIDDILAVHRALDPSRPAAWEGFAAVAGLPVAAAERAGLAHRFRAAEPPPTARGLPDQRWVRALERAAGCLEAGDWSALLGNGLCGALLAGGGYHGAAIPEHVEGLAREALAMARAELGARYDRQAQALAHFAALFAHRVDERHREAALFGFDDLTRFLAASMPGASIELDALFYRLDARIRHVLLDEFQDTSLVQAAALRPILDEVFGDAAGERAGVIVADPKQSIYAWRGASPELVAELRNRYAPTSLPLSKSWRSSPVVLDFVNQVFSALPGLPVWDDEAAAADVVADWLRWFSPHTAHFAELPGHVRIEAGPADEGRGQGRPRLCRRAARLVAELHARAPGASIGVLTRRNATVAQMMLELKRAGIHASEEGGNAVTDAAAVTSMLALLRLADHPASMVPRYHVARSPVGAAVGYTDGADDGGAHALAHRVRRQLLEIGYGPFLSSLAGRIRDACDDRETRRVAQLVELAFRYEPGASLRPSDFVHWAASQKVEDPTTAGVRVMTVHQSKGLEFDIVVLPELDAPLFGARRGGVLAYRPSPTALVSHAFPYVPAPVRPLFDSVPHLEEAAVQARASELRDALSSLYVAMTRARHALHVVVQPDGPGGPSAARTGARVLREALGRGVDAIAEGDVIHESGDADWYRFVERPARPAAPLPATQAVTLARRPRSRVLPRRSPSDLEGGAYVDLGNVLRLGAAPARLRGTVVHRWIEQVAWLEDGVPRDDELLRHAAEVATDLPQDEVNALLHRFRRWLQAPAVAAVLSREAARAAMGAASLAVDREVPFLYREGDILLEGIIDRLVTAGTGGEVAAARIIDFKTDDVAVGAGLAERVRHYTPQMEAYRRAVAAMYRLPEPAVSASLVFLEAGEVVSV